MSVVKGVVDFDVVRVWSDVTRERWWLEFSIDCEMSPHTFSAGIAGSLVEAPLNLDDAKVLFSRFDCAGFVLLRAVYRKGLLCCSGGMSNKDQSSVS